MSVHDFGDPIASSLGPRTTQGSSGRTEDPARARIASTLLLLGGLSVLGSLALPWLSAVTVQLPSGTSTFDFTWHVWDTFAGVGVLLVLLPLLWLLPAGVRGIRGMPSALGRRKGLFLAFGGLLGTVVFFLVLWIAAVVRTFVFLIHVRTNHTPELGAFVCLAGYILLLVGAALRPARARTRP